jgi:lactoylglutathione lyase
MKLYNTRLLVKDFRTTFLFYRDTLGLTPTSGDEDGVYTEFQTGGALLALFQSDLMEQVLGGGQPLSIHGRDQAALVFEVADVDEAVGQLQARGVAFQTLPEDRPDWGIRTAHLRDPEGNLIEVYSPLAR